MNAPKRRGSAPAEATQELQALDVLEIVETLKPPQVALAARKAGTSNPSIAPVGLDLPSEREGADEEANPTMDVRLPPQRRRLGGVVIAAVAACALILLAAGIARVSHASSSPAADDSASTSAPPAPQTTAQGTSTAGTGATGPATAPPTTTGTSASPAAPDPSPATTSTDGTGTGTLRLDRPAVPGRVWLDGKKLSSGSAMVTCGPHQIRVGRGRTHAITVPCGGELGVSR